MCAFKLYRYIGLKGCYFLYKYQFDICINQLENNILLSQTFRYKLYVYVYRKQNRYYFNHAVYIIGVINILKIVIFTPQSIFVILANFTIIIIKGCAFFKKKSCPVFVCVYIYIYIGYYLCLNNRLMFIDQLQIQDL